MLLCDSYPEIGNAKFRCAFWIFKYERRISIVLLKTSLYCDFRDMEWFGYGWLHLRKIDSGCNLCYVKIHYRAALISVNFGCFAPSRCEHCHCNAMWKISKTSTPQFHKYFAHAQIIFKWSWWLCTLVSKVKLWYFSTKSSIIWNSSNN